jgi:hypothetical protein
MKFLSVLLFGFVLACSQGNSSGDGLISKERSYALEEEVPITEDLTPGYNEDDNEGDLVHTEQKIIKTAHLTFESKDPELTHEKILGLTKDFKGFVQSDHSGKDYGRVNFNIVIRVPTENFQSMIDGVSNGVDYFDQKEISRKDVTEEFVDLQARLKAKRQLEERYLQLLKQAKNVKEMLEIERELSKIREEIEAKEGRLQYLQNKVSLSTIYINFYKTTSSKGVSMSYGQKMVNALKGGWNGISVFFLGLLYIWPLLLVIGILTFILRRYLKRLKKKKQ